MAYPLFLDFLIQLVNFVGMEELPKQFLIQPRITNAVCHYEAIALPTELRRQVLLFCIKVFLSCVVVKSEQLTHILLNFLKFGLKRGTFLRFPSIFLFLEALRHS